MLFKKNMYGLDLHKKFSNFFTLVFIVCLACQLKR